MNYADVKKRAKAAGVVVGKESKGELIQEIQIKEGNFPCFGSANGYCDQSDCLWRQDCLA